MTITKEFASKLAVAFVAVAMVFAAFAPAAKAQTTEDLQQMINDLLAQVAGLQSQLGQGATSAAGVCPYTWTRDLSSGSTGADVMKLQQFLNADADTRVAAEGAGSVGMETEYYGPATAAAVSKMQVKYRADILSPANLVNPTGYFGPSSRAKANSLCVAAPVVDDSTDEDATEDEDEDEDKTLSGEASLKSFELDGADEDTIEEGAEDAPIGLVTFEFEDGDAEISRFDIALVANVANTEKDPWDVFESVSMWVDGDKVAEKSADRKSDYLNEDAGTLRFSGLDFIAMEDEEVEITIAATLQNNLKYLPEDWTVDVASVRFFDADGVATTDSPSVPAVGFTIETAGYEDEILVKISSNDPDAATLEVKDNAKSDWYDVFVFDLDTDDSINDISIDSITVQVLTTKAGYSTLVDDAEITIDGTTIDDVTVTLSTTTIAGDTAALKFDVDGDVVIDAGDRVEAELALRFKKLDNPAYEGATVKASITTVGTNPDVIVAEGSDDLDTSKITGTATGDAHTLRTSGVAVTDFSISSTVENNTNTPANSTASFVAEFSLEVIGDDEVYVPLNTAIMYAAGSTTKGVVYRIEDANSAMVSTTTSLSAIFQKVGGGGDTSVSPGYLYLQAGEVADVKLSVTFDPTTAGYYTMIVDSVNFNGAASPANEAVELRPATDYDVTTSSSVNN